MKHEVFVLGGQRIDQKSKNGWKRLGEMRKGRRERMRKGAIVSSSPGAQASKFGFFKLIECIIKMSWCETECRNMRHW